MIENPSLNIMVIEDNDSLREATIAFLSSQGHQSVGLVCAEEVDETPVRDLPDLYLIDVNLPGEDGFSLARRIRQSQPLAGIILITARGQAPDRVEGYNTGADNYLVKPVDQSELQACINNLGRRLKTATSPTASEFLLDSSSLCLKGPSAEVTLTHGESLLLTGLGRAAGQKLERWQAMQLVDTKDKGLLPANLEMRISTLRKKLNACGAPEDAIRTLRGFGYALHIRITII